MGRNAERRAGVMVETCSNSSDCSSFLVTWEVKLLAVTPRGEREGVGGLEGEEVEESWEGEWTWVILYVGCRAARGPLEVCGNN